MVDDMRRGVTAELKRGVVMESVLDVLVTTLDIRDAMEESEGGSSDERLEILSRENLRVNARMEALRRVIKTLEARTEAKADGELTDETRMARVDKELSQTLYRLSKRQVHGDVHGGVSTRLEEVDGLSCRFEAVEEAQRRLEEAMTKVEQGQVRVEEKLGRIGESLVG